MKIIATNKKAFHDYHILDTIEAGIVLIGDEVKAIKAGHISLKGAYATIRKGELFLINAHIAPYEKAFQKQDEQATRSRKLLLKRRQLNKLIGDISRKGITVMPLKIYVTKRGLIKIELGIAKHKKMADKRQAIKERDIKREAQREIKKALK